MLPSVGYYCFHVIRVQRNSIMKHKSTRLILFTMLTVVVEAASLTADERRAMTLVDLLNIPSLSSPRLSPDGRQLLYVLEKADWEANKQIGHIWRR